MSHIDENGDAEGNYTVLARTLYASQYSNYSMRPVGYFVKVSSGSSIDELPVRHPTNYDLLNVSFVWIAAHIGAIDLTVVAISASLYST